MKNHTATSRTGMPLISLLILIAVLFIPGLLDAQQKQVYKNIQEAMRASAMLAGKSAPRSLNWIDNSNRYSYIATNDSTKREEIRSFDPRTGKDELIFDAQGLTFPDTNKQFEYRSFQWANDSRHILFETNFRRMYRRSGISDYYVYSIADKSLKVGAKNARTADSRLMARWSVTKEAETCTCTISARRPRPN